MNRQQQNRRSLGGLPKAEGVHGLPMIQPDGAIPNRSPLSQPTPGSHLPSPVASATRSPNFIPQGTSVSPNFGSIPPQQQPQRHQQLQPQPPRSQFTPIMAPQRPSVITNQQPSNGISNASSGGGASVMTQNSTSGGPQSYFPTPYSEHMTQLGKLSHPCIGCIALYPRLMSSCRTRVRRAKRHARPRRSQRSVRWAWSVPAPLPTESDAVAKYATSHASSAESALHK